MALEIFHNKAETHENEQFRRVSKIIEKIFNEKNYTGILVGNPFNENYKRFRPDAILLYDNGAIIIDFKDYSGKLYFPENADLFKSHTWFIEKADGQEITVKAGKNYLNPFLQLASYRASFKEIIDNNTILKNKINSSRICAINIFTGPLEKYFNVPGKYPYYKVVDENELSDFLYDQNDDNAYSEEIASEIRRIFPANSYNKKTQYSENILSQEQLPSIEKDVINNFIQSKQDRILVLSSTDNKIRDGWAEYIYQVAHECVPEIQSICHSRRISWRLQKRGIDALSMYSEIYDSNNLLKADENDNTTLQIAPIKNNNTIDDNALIIVHDAHLVSRSMRQSDLLRFGTGRLLEDLFTFFYMNSNRKIVFIGDSHLLSYGRIEDSAMSSENLKEISGDTKIKYYTAENQNQILCNKDKLRLEIAKHIDAKIYNNLKYDFSDNSIKNITTEESLNKMREWFSEPFTAEPNRAALFYAKDSCMKANLWIKNHCLKNGDKLAVGDLLISCNNFFIPDDTGLNNLQSVSNGMYFSVEKILDFYNYSIKLKGRNIATNLSFTKISARCLSLDRQLVDLWILNNYLSGEGELSTDEQVAMKIFLDGRLSKKMKDVLTDSSSLNDEDQKNLEKKIRMADQFFNVMYAKYGWAITVHKAVGSGYDEVLLKGCPGENIGITNGQYYRWLYSGLTSSVGDVYIHEPQIIDPYINCKIELVNKYEKNSNNLLMYSNYILPEKYTKIFNSSNINIVGAISELSQKLEKYNYFLAKVENCGPYQSRAFYAFSDDTDNSLIIDFYNKDINSSSHGGVSKILVKSSEKFNVSKVNEIISQLFDSCEQTSQIEVPEYIKNIYNDFIDKMNDKNIIIKHENSNEYQDVFTATTKSGQAKLRFYYGTSEQNHTKGFINKIEVFNLTDESILVAVKEYIYGRKY